MAGGAGAAGGMGAPSAANNTMPSFGTPAPGSGISQIAGNTLSNMANPTGVNNGTMGSSQIGVMDSRGGAPAAMQQLGMMQRPPMMGGFGDVIRRQAFNPMMGQGGGYAGPRPPQIFQPNIAPQVQQTANPQKSQAMLDAEAQALRYAQENPGGSSWSSK